MKSLMNRLDEKSAIKSIQRGTFTSYKNENISITISEVNPDRCVVILDGVGTTYNYPTSVSLVSLTENTLTVQTPSLSSSTYAGTYSWQVIEFC